MTEWIISDLHLGHVKIRDYEPMRQAWGPDWQSMTETIINGWNSVVQPGDTVYCLGDFAMGLPENMAPYRRRMNGKIILVRGNHDRKPEIWLQPQDILVERLEWDHPTLGHLIARHDPHHFTVEEAERATWLLHGHLHSGNHRADTPEVIRNKVVCVSIERMPTPAPIPLSDVIKVLRPV